MSKRLPLILTIALVIIAGSYFLYERLTLKHTIGPWQLIPESSIGVYESGSCAECVDSIKLSSIWKVIKEASFYAKPSDSLINVFKILQDAPHKLVSLQVTKKDDFEFIFFVNNDSKVFDKLNRSWLKNSAFKSTEREFNSVKIHEVSYSNRVFSWVLLDRVWVGTFTPFLIEDVIRVYESGKGSRFKTDSYQMPKMKNEGGNIYINLSNFYTWLKIFSQTELADLSENFGTTSILDVKADGHNFVLKGFSSDSSGNSHYALSLFADQIPVPFNLKQFASNRTVMFSSFGISDGNKFNQRLLQSNLRPQKIKDTLNQLSKSKALDINSLYKSINGEVAVSYVESKKNSLSKVLIIQTSNSKTWIDSFNAASAKLSLDTVFYERFSDYEIHELPIYRFPEKMFYPLVTGFNQSYYTNQGNAIFLSDDLEVLKRYLEDIDKEDTWGKSVVQNTFLESTLLEANVSLYINTPKIWNVINNSLSPKWQDFVSENKNLLRSIEMGSMQLSHLGESFYTNVLWQYHFSGKPESRQVNSQKFTTNFNAAIAKLFVVKNHNDRVDELLVQDSSFNLQLTSREGKILWKIALDAVITGDVEQIDYLNNGKLQYFFTTNNKVYIIDRQGNSIAHFPLNIEGNELEYSSVVDYDHSRKYRFLLADRKGKLWMFDKNGKNLDGWQPKNIEGRLITAPQHHRIKGKDYVVAIREDGKIYIINRRGETLNNFPLDLETKLDGSYFIEMGNDLASTYFVVVSKDGYKIRFTIDGKIQSREPLLKNSNDATFKLIREKEGKGYLIARQEAKQLTLIDESNKTLLTNDFIGHNPIDIHYTDFGSGKTFIVLTDLHQELTFIYDNGDLLTSPPLESSYLDIRLKDDKPTIFVVYKNSISTQPLQ